MLPRTRQSTRGNTLAELLVSVSVFFLLLGATFFFIQLSKKSSVKMSGAQLAAAELYKAESRLRRDLFGASYSTLQVQAGPSYLSGRDGDCFWFLSAIDPATNTYIRNIDGSPRWQRNILYYCVVPSGNMGDFTGSGINDGGYEMGYPYKFLVKKVIDYDTPTDPSSQETLIPAADITAYLERPNGFTLVAASSESASIVAHDLLCLVATKDDNLESIVITLKAANVDAAKKLFPIGSQSLNAAPFLQERRIEFFPQNKDLTVAPPP